MKDEKQKPEGSEQDFSEFAKDHASQPGKAGRGRSFLRGCGIAAGIVALIFFFIVGACFIGLSRW